MNEERTKKRILKGLVIFLIVAVISSVCITFAFYKSEPLYVKNEIGEKYIDAKGNPEVYYKDLFGNTFYLINGKREYSAVPSYKDSHTFDSEGHIITTTEPTSAES